MAWWQHPIVRGAFIGFVAAAVVDLRAWKSFEEAKFNLTTAAWRWFQGAMTGAVAAAGLGELGV